MGLEASNARPPMFNNPTSELLRKIAFVPRARKVVAGHSPARLEPTWRKTTPNAAPTERAKADSNFVMRFSLRFVAYTSGPAPQP